MQKETPNKTPNLRSHTTYFQLHILMSLQVYA